MSHTMNIFKLSQKNCLTFVEKRQVFSCKKSIFTTVTSILTKIHKIVLIERCFQGTSRFINLFRVASETGLFTKQAITTVGFMGQKGLSTLIVDV